MATIALLSGLAAMPAIGGALAQAAPTDEPNAILRGTSAGTSVNAPPDSGAARPVSPINYGKPKKYKRLLPKQLGRPAVRPLPALQAYPSAPQTRRRGIGAAPDELGPTVTAIPVIARPRRPVVDPAPFEPIGIPVGALRLKPYIETDIGYDTNPNRQAGGAKGSWFGRGEAGGTLQSNWSVHEFDATLKAGYSDYFSDKSASRPDANAVVNGRIDATRDLAFDVQGRFVLDSQRAGSVGVLQNVTLRDRPLTYAFGASLGATQKINRLTLSLRGTIDRSSNDNATGANGQTINLALGDYNSYGLRGRAAYELTPGVSPFIEVVADQRRYDSAIDTSGFARSSSGIGGKLGSTFELTRILTGEISAGYARRNYDDTRLRTLSGPTVDALLVWTATPLTTVTLQGSTALNETTVANSSGALTRTINLSVAHALFRNFTLTGAVSYQNADYQGASLHENTFAASLKADYNLTRSVVVRSSFTHQRLQSSVPGADYTANTVLLGLRFQQ